MKKNKTSTRISFNRNSASGPLIEQLAVKVLGAEKLLEDPDVTVFQIPDGTILESYGMSSFSPQKALGGSGAVPSFRVDNIDTAVNHMVAAGATALDGIIRTCDAFAYCHLMLGGGQVVGLYQQD